MKVKLFFAFALFIGIYAFTACSDSDSGSGEPNQGSGVSDESDEWIDPTFAKVLEEKGYIADAATVTPDDVADIMTVYVNGELLKSMKGIEYFESLVILHCADNELVRLDVSKCLNLVDLYCNNNLLTEIKLNADIEKLSCSDNKLTQLDVSKCKQLKTLHIDGNLFKQIDISKNNKLNYLSCACMYLSQLDVSNNTQLSYLSCGDNLLTQLDISQNTKLTLFYCHENPGVDGVFRVKAWFDNDNIPKNIDNIGVWYYKDKEVKVFFYK